MTRKEQTGIRDLSMSAWIRNNLPDSRTGFSVTDIDFLLLNHITKKAMLIEVKTNMSRPSFNQKKLLQLVCRWIRRGIDDDYRYMGCHLIQFQNKSFNDGKCFLDYNEITEEELIKFLSI